MTKQRELLYSIRQVLNLLKSYYGRSRRRFEERMSFERGAPVGKWTPSEARYEFRTNPELEGSPTTGYCMGYLQANLAILPSSLAEEFEQFCGLNKAPCPLLYRSKRGELSAGILARESDVRTDLPKYCVSENGIVTETWNLMAYPMDNYTSFYIGCSFSFEEALTDAGIQLQNVVKNCNVSMYITNIPLVPVGPFATPMVVSMRPIPKDLVEKTLIITAAYDAVHGAPIHIGDPSVIGIKDIHDPHFGDPSDVGDLIPVFWACGVTSSLAVRSAKPPLSFSHFPGSMFICDTTVEEYFKTHKPDHGKEQPSLVTLTDQPFLASVCSVSAVQKVKELAKLLESPSVVDETMDTQSADFLKVAIRLSHAPSVVIGFLDEKESLSSSSSDGLQGILALSKALQVLNKKVSIVTQYHSQMIQDFVSGNASQLGILKDGISIVEVNKSSDIKKAVYPDEIHHRLDTMIGFQLAQIPCTYEESTEAGVVDVIFKEANDWTNRMVSIKITIDRRQTSLAGDVSSVDSHTIPIGSVKMATSCLSAALYVLNNCPIHSRYVRRGIGKRQLFEVGDFLLNQVISLVDFVYVTMLVPLILNGYILQYKWIRNFP